MFTRNFIKINILEIKKKKKFYIVKIKKGITITMRVLTFIQLNNVSQIKAIMYSFAFCFIQYEAERV